MAHMSSLPLPPLLLLLLLQGAVGRLERRGALSSHCSCLSLFTPTRLIHTPVSLLLLLLLLQGAL
jgi:hypothetical protein